jgi:membrane-associated protein
MAIKAIEDSSLARSILIKGKCMNFVDIFFHLDTYLGNYLFSTLGNWIYLILFLIIFLETGVIVMAFLPGDSLLFIMGGLVATGATGEMGPNFVYIASAVMIAGAVLGDTVNFHIGKAIGPKVFERENARFFNHKMLLKTHEFYDKYGGIVIIVARFIAFIRVFAPFVAGVGLMNYKKFILYNIIGGILWVPIVIAFGYLFANIPVVRNNFSIIFIVLLTATIIAISLSVSDKFKKKKKPDEPG